MMCHLELKPGVRLHRTSAEILFAVEVVREVWEEFGASACVITAGVDGTHSTLGEHYKGDALDFRTVGVPEIEKAVETVAHRLGSTVVSQSIYSGPNYLLILEDRGMPNEHLHISYRPTRFE